VATVREAASSRSFFQRPAVVAAVFLLPFIVLFLVFRVWAILQAILLSFQEVESVGSSEWTGLSNYRDLASDPLFYTALRNTAMYTAGTLLLLIPIPFVLAAVLHSGLVKRAHAFRTVLFLPILTSLVVVGVVFQLLLNTDGILNNALASVGLPRLRWLESKHLAIPAMLIMATWRWTGINIIYFTTGLANIPQDLYEAAAVDGASGISRFFHISVPLSKPIILFVTVLSVIGGFQLFVEPYILWQGAGGGPGRGGLSIVVLLYRSAFTSFRLGYAAAIGVVLALIIMVVSLMQFRFFGFFKKE
jgi:arabinosaccharide transport system permease protein